MAPGVIGDERQLLVAHGKLTLLVEVERLGVGRQRDDGRASYLSLAQAELRFLTDEGREHVELIIRMLSTIDQRATLDGNHAAVGLHLVVGTHDARLHVEVQLNLVALLPAAGDVHVAIIF